MERPTSTWPGGYQRVPGLHPDCDRGCLVMGMVISEWEIPNILGNLYEFVGIDDWLVLTGTMEFYDFPIILGMECHHPNWWTPFFRGVGIPPTSQKSLGICREWWECKGDVVCVFLFFTLADMFQWCWKGLTHGVWNVLWMSDMP